MGSGYRLRLLSVFVLWGHPHLFGAYFCIVGIAMGRRGLTASLVAEVLAAIVGIWTLRKSFIALSDRRDSAIGRNEKIFVACSAACCILLVLTNLANAESSGLFAKSGNRLGFYFANDWFRRLVTYSIVPLMVATYSSVNAMLSPLARGKRWLFAGFLLSFLAYTLSSGSKGSSVLMIAAAMPFVFTIQRFPIAKLVVAMLGVTAGYLFLFLSFTSDRTMSLLAIVQRFYLSIDMSLLLVSGHGTAEIIAARLGDVWVEIFRNLNWLGVRVADQPIGAMIYQYSLGTLPTVGANCRYASLLLLYPDRLDFLLLYPLFVILIAYLLADIFRILNFARGALIAVPWFVFQAFQDAYWFTANCVPIVAVFVLMRAGEHISRGSFRRLSSAPQR